jgi:hypothetical protein
MSTAPYSETVISLFTSTAFVLDRTVYSGFTAAGQLFFNHWHIHCSVLMVEIVPDGKLTDLMPEKPARVSLFIIW